MASRISQAFLSKLKALSTVDGQPDFSEIGEPAPVAKQWAAEIALTHEQLLEQLLEHLKENSQT